MSVGLMPSILEACPSVSGLTEESLSIDSAERPAMFLYEKSKGIKKFSSFL